MPMTKRQIESRAISGSHIAASDVAAVARDGRTITVRHVWRDHDDGRVLSSVKRAWMQLAREVADRTGREVEVYSKNGDLIDQVRPSQGQGGLSRREIEEDIRHVLG